jgi:hypothetical protein
MRYSSAREFYIVGAFESPRLCYFPTHLQPIIVEKKPSGFQRWSYSIEKPYSIKLHATVGLVRPIGELFPIKSFIFLDLPVRLHRKTQLIALSQSSFIVSRSRMIIVLKLIVAILARFPDMYFAKRACKTIYNSVL